MVRRDSNLSGWIRRKKMLCGFRRIACVVATTMAAGCAVHKQVQYFAATDPETGLTNYYRLTVSGSGGWGTDYHIQTGYFSSAAVDMLRGSMPDVPELDLPIEQLEVFDRLTGHFYAALIQEAKRVHGVSDCEALVIATQSNRNNAERRLGKLDAKAKHVERELTRATAKVTRATANETRAQEALDAVAGELDQLETARSAAEEAVEAAETALGEAATDGRSAAEAELTAKQKELGKIVTLVGKKRAALESAERTAREAESAGDAARRAEERVRSKHESMMVDVARNTAARDAANEMLSLLKSRCELVPMSGLAEGSEVQPFQDPKIIELARLVWYGSLSSSDLASIGMTGNTSPYQFRKLVFWAAATNIDLNEFATEIDAVLDNSLAIASNAKAQAKRRSAEKTSRRESVGSILENLGLPGDKTDALKGLLDLVSPPPSDSAATSPEGVDNSIQPLSGATP